MDPATESAPRRRHRRSAALAGLVALLAVAVPVAWASHQFTDVSDANPFHAEIGAIAGAGITGGKTCVPPGTPPTYCPDETVTRQAMAAFMHRGFGRVGTGTTAVPVVLSTTDADLAVVAIQVGGVPGQTQFVQLDGAFTAFTTDNAGCPCTSTFHFDRVGGPDLIGSYQYATNDLIGTGGYHLQSGALAGAIAVASGTTHTFRMRGTRVFNLGGTVSGYGTMTATVIPFGSGGASTLGTTAAAPGSPANPTR